MAQNVNCLNLVTEHACVLLVWWCVLPWFTSEYGRGFYVCMHIYIYPYIYAYTHKLKHVARVVKLIPNVWLYINHVLSHFSLECVERQCTFSVRPCSEQCHVIGLRYRLCQAMTCSTATATWPFAAPDSALGLTYSAMKWATFRSPRYSARQCSV